MSENLDYFKLTRDFWEFSFENPELIKPNHCALFCFIVEHCNRLGWKPKFGLPTEMTKDAIGIKNYKTYSSTLNDLIDWGFIKMVEKSKNQYSSNIVALVKNTKASTKALSKATSKHSPKQVQSTIQSIDSIDKQDTLIPKNKKPFYKEFAHLSITYEDFELLKNEFEEKDILDCFDRIENYKENTKYKSLYLTSKQWLKKQKEDKLKTQTNGQSISTKKPSYRNSLQQALDNNKQAEFSNTERELSEDTEFEVID